LHWLLPVAPPRRYPGRGAGAEAVPTSAHIVIIGAGAAGTALVNRLVDRLEGAQITLIDPRVEHLYQPGLTLVAAGLKPPSYVVSQTTDWLPDGVALIPERVAAVDPEAQTVSTEGGETLDYDFLVVAPGLILDHDAIEGFSLDMVGENGIGALYAGPDYAARTWQAASRFIEDGGRGVFTRPATEMKCAGAPLKHTFLIDDRLTRAGQPRECRADRLHRPAVFALRSAHRGRKVRMLFDERDINYTYGAR
jgi:sulfide:quinone oxidoreductase